MHSIRRQSRTRVGSVLVALLVALVILTVIVSAVGTLGARNQQITAMSVEGDQARLAAEGVAQMGVKELFDNVDRDGDGTIGSISNDGNIANDPTIGGARGWATVSTSGLVSTVSANARSTNASALIRATVEASGSSSPATAGTVLLVVVNASSLDSLESARKTLIESWGYTVTPISESATQAQFDAAARAASVAYIVETVLSTNVGTKLTNATIGVITEESSLSDELGISSGMTTMTASTINITNTTHYITSTLSAGSQAIFTSGQPVRYLSGTLGGFTTLGQRVGGTDATLAVMERGATLTPSGSAAGRRVYLPWGNTGFDPASLNTTAQTIMKRSIEWCLQPVAYWALDDAAGTTAVDSIAGRNGTLVGATWGTGKLNGGASFNGTTNYITIANATAFQVTNALSVVGWVRANTWGGSIDVDIILRKGDANPNHWQLDIADGRLEMVLNGNDDVGFQGSTALATATWYHVAGTWDGANVRLYVNGVLDNAAPSYTSTLPTDTRPVYLGGRIGSTDVIDGIVDEVRFYDRALTAAEVSALYNAGSPTTRKVTSWTEQAP